MKSCQASVVNGFVEPGQGFHVEGEELCGPSRIFQFPAARYGYSGGTKVIIKSDLDACRKDLQNFIGTRIRLTSNGGRKRIIVHEGILDHCYPNVFTVRCLRQNSETAPEVVSYSYVDVLTKAVEIAMIAGVAVSAG